MERWEEALGYWRQIADRWPWAALPALEEIAKYYEHRAHELQPAIEACQRALEVAAQHSAAFGADAARWRLWRRRFGHRLERLGRKAQRASPPSAAG